MPNTIRIKGRFSVPWASPDDFELPSPEVFLLGEDGATDRRFFVTAAEYGRRSLIIS